jgi:hypothetical protein
VFCSSEVYRLSYQKVDNPIQSEQNIVVTDVRHLGFLSLNAVEYLQYIKYLTSLAISSELDAMLNIKILQHLKYYKALSQRLYNYKQYYVSCKNYFNYFINYHKLAYSFLHFRRFGSRSVRRITNLVPRVCLFAG